LGFTQIFFKQESTHLIEVGLQRLILSTLLGELSLEPLVLDLLRLLSAVTLDVFAVLVDEAQG
jgi:hypothetical protein